MFVAVGSQNEDTGVRLFKMVMVVYRLASQGES